MAGLAWDIFCRVVDNFGDAGVCWRLASELAARGDTVRLVIDDPAPLAFMAPSGCQGVQVLPWPGPAEPADVVVEAFGCDPPAPFAAAMAARQAAPVWINLEYLSAEPYVERSHGLPSPQRNGLAKWFFYPGFTPRTGGLLREADLPARQRGFERQAWLAAQGLQAAAGERVVSLFCYANPALPALLQSLAASPTLLLLTPGPAQAQVTQAPPGVRLARLPWLSQSDFDHLLWASDINLVRGEDSLVRAIWADRPFVWQAYPQDDGAHVAKVQALLDRMAAPPPVAALWRAWNGFAAAGWPGLPEAWRDAPAAAASWNAALGPWLAALRAQDDLATQLRAFASGKAPGPC